MRVIISLAENARTTCVIISQAENARTMRVIISLAENARTLPTERQGMLATCRRLAAERQGMLATCRGFGHTLPGIAGNLPRYLPSKVKSQYLI